MEMVDQGLVEEEAEEEIEEVEDKVVDVIEEN